MRIGHRVLQSGLGAGYIRIPVHVCKFAISFIGECQALRKANCAVQNQLFDDCMSVAHKFLTMPYISIDYIDILRICAYTNAIFSVENKYQRLQSLMT